VGRERGRDGVRVVDPPLLVQLQMRVVNLKRLHFLPVLLIDLLLSKLTRMLID
jgi:hypothetical protein